MSAEYRAYITKIHDLRQDIRDSLTFIGWKNIVKNDDTVFVKPNFTYPFNKVFEKDAIYGCCYLFQKLIFYGENLPPNLSLNGCSRCRMGTIRGHGCHSLNKTKASIIRITTFIRIKSE